MHILLCHILYHFYVALQKHTPKAHPDHVCLNNAVEKMKKTLRLVINLYAKLTQMQDYFAYTYCLLYTHI